MGTCSPSSSTNFIFRKEKTKKTFNHFKPKNGQPIAGQDNGSDGQLNIDNKLKNK